MGRGRVAARTSARQRAKKAAPRGSRRRCGARAAAAARRSPATRSTLSRASTPRRGPTPPAAREDRFLFEQPEHDRAAIGALGAACRIDARGPGRFREVADRWRELAADAVVGEGARPVAVRRPGGFAFAPDGGAAAHWQP